MPRKLRFPPYPAKPHASNQARICVQGETHYLGEHGSPESWAEYHRLLGLWRKRQEDGPPPVPAAGPAETVGALLARYMEHARRKYRHPDGRPKGELSNIRHGVEPLARLHARTPLPEFGTKALRGLLEATATGSWLTAAEKADRLEHGRNVGWCRRLVNLNLSRVKSVFRWGVLEELLPGSQLHDLTAVRGLAEGEYGVRETGEVPPVPEGDLAKVLPRLGPVVREFVELLLLTGARPSELLRLTPSGLNREGEVEVAKGYKVQLGAGVVAYQPDRHKTAHRGHKRVILFGPQAQALLAPLLEGRAPDAPLFSPREARARRNEAARAARKTKVQPSQDSRARPGARRPADCYTVDVIGDDVERACGRAGVPRWTLYQLRHSAGSRIASEFSPEVARILLGHTDLRTTRSYLVDDLHQVAQALREVG
jgi:integrase